MPLVGVSGRLLIHNQRNRNERRRSSLTNTATVHQVKPQRRSSNASTASNTVTKIPKKGSVSPDIHANRHSVPDAVPHGAPLTTPEIGSDAWKQFNESRVPPINGATSVDSSDEELPNGKKAWNKKNGKRPGSRFNGKNKVGDIKGNQEDDIEKYRQTGVVNIVLYLGFFFIGIGMVLTFIGMGDRGFKSKELKAIGPSLIGCGVLFCILRLVFCSITPFKKKNKKLDEKSLLSPSKETLDTDSTTGNGIPPLMKRPSAATATIVGAHVEEQQQHRISNQPPRPMTSTIPNFIEDEGENDQDLGLEVDYINDNNNAIRRPWSTTSSATSRTLPEINSHRASEVILDPSRLKDGSV